MITNHTQLLNYLIKKHDLKSYLEIGVQSSANNFDLVNLKYKVGVDPEITPVNRIANIALVRKTSDEFFEINIDTFDLVFIDGLHHADQVKRDFENSLKCLDENGIILIHDVLPEIEDTTHVPRDSKVWHGDVYKWALHLYEYGLEFRTISSGARCAVVKNQPIYWVGEEKKYLPLPVEETFEFYLKHRKSLLRMIEPSEIETYL